MTITLDGFCVTVEFGNGAYHIAVWPCDENGKALFYEPDASELTPTSFHGLRCNIEAAQKIAMVKLGMWRQIAEHFREEGRAEVRAAQGELALAAFERGRDEGQRCTDRPALSTTGGTE